MKLGLIILIMTLGLAAAPLSARAGGTDNADAPTAVKSAPVTAEAPKEVTKPETPAIDREVQDLRGLVEELRTELDTQRIKVAALEEKLRATPSEPTPNPVVTPYTTSRRATRFINGISATPKRSKPRSNRQST